MRSYTEEEKAVIMQSVKENGVRGTARKYGIPLSTLSMWRMNSGEIRARAIKYSEDMKRRAVDQWLNSLAFNKSTLVASSYGVSVQSLRKWVHKYANEAARRNPSPRAINKDVVRQQGPVRYKTPPGTERVQDVPIVSKP